MKRSQFLEGIRFWFKGVAYFINRPVLWKYFFVTVLLNLFIVSILFYFGWDFISDKLPDINFENLSKGLSIFKATVGWLKALSVFVFEGLIWILTVIFFAIFYVLAFVILASVIGSPIYELLSKRIEILEGSNVKDIPFSIKNNITYPVINALKMMVFELSLVIILFPLNWIPVMGSFIYIVILLFPLVMTLITYCSERRFWKFSQLTGFIWRNKMSFFGFGMVSFISMIPFGLSIITFPLSVSGATLLFLEKNKEEKK